jgi:hypothetical protein
LRDRLDDLSQVQVAMDGLAGQLNSGLAIMMKQAFLLFLEADAKFMKKKNENEVAKMEKTHNNLQRNSVLHQ